MPHESEPQARTWMGWPAASYMLDGSIVPVDDVWGAWAAVAGAIVDVQPVTMLVAPGHEHTARRLLPRAVELLVVPVDDAWLRDSGPTFVRDTARGDALAAVSWEFNAWGGLELAETAADNALAPLVAERAGATLVRSAMVNEGGGMQVDGAGTVIVTETVQRDPQRNPGWSRAEIERELTRTIGARHVIWLPRGLARDYSPLGTRGHADMVAAFSAPGTVLLHDQRDPAHPDHALTRRLRAQLARETDADGRPLRIVDLPSPTVLRDAGGWVDLNYANHAVVNGAVIMGVFDDPADDEAREVLGAAYPGRELIGVDARAVFALGGGIHCITQNQPAVQGT
ncbi:agmatine deiminase [Microbacterium sp. No. 7]|nr:agmatine deiminase family protein [Microbacterium sp. No. 7]ALJ20096.1 agmatine deiminase [Microbacterium sp. No. 7]